MDVKKLTLIVAPLLLLVMGSLAFFSMKRDALTFDELAHIGAGYSYVTQQDYRINPEHPPLIKDLSALPLLFLNLHFPKDSPNWIQKDAPAWWVQFDFGTDFLYRSGNNPREVIFWARIPMILLLLVLGWFLFKWARELLGDVLGIFVLALFAFSPAFLAHGRLVTTDVGAALGALLAMYFWIKFLHNPNPKLMIAASLGFGAAMLMKFSLILLIPTFFILTVAYVLLHAQEDKMKVLIAYMGKSLLIGICALIFVVAPFYQFHVSNYPAEQQARDTAFDLSPRGITFIERIVIEMADVGPFRSLSQFFHGILMALQRGESGNTVYILGKISGSGVWYYFPVVYFYKEPAALHVFLLLGILGVIWFFKQKNAQNFLKQHFAYFSFALFIALYWAVALAGNLNIGERHLLPTLPFIYLLIAWGLRQLLVSSGRFSPESSRDVKNRTGLSFAKLNIIQKSLAALIALVLAWYASSSLAAFPHYIPYYNGLAGGMEQGYKIATDSNYDWGQDFHLLVDAVERHDIQKLYLDYFGGEDPKYYLGERFIKLDPQTANTEFLKGWIAVSINHYVGGTALPFEGFDQQTGYYNWLKGYTPIEKIGNTILLYHIE